MRPLNAVEIREEQSMADYERTACKWLFDHNTISLMQSDPALNQSQSPMKKGGSQPQSQSRHYQFDHCFDEVVDNFEVYRRSSKEIIASSLQGINGTIFMYGQTGAGKTHTMLGEYSAGILNNQPQKPETEKRAKTPHRTKRHTSTSRVVSDHQYNLLETSFSRTQGKTTMR
jgi:chromosomal replication initiation ATPase DnaA